MSDADNAAKQTGAFEQIIVFAVKTCIVVVTISVCVLFVAEEVVYNLQDAVARTISDVRTTPIGGRQAWTKLEEELDRAANPSNDLPPEKKQKLLNDVHVIVARWRPFLEAIQSEMQKPAGAN
jgi:hypothetical protein